MQSRNRVREVWSAGSYETVAEDYLGMAAELVDETGVGAGDEVLDVGCGTGNVAITAARAGATVTGLDITPSMLEAARENATTAGVEGVEWREGDATELPVAEDRYDATLSNLGHVFGDPPDAAASELLRVTRSGGAIGFTSWTPSGLFPEMAGVLASTVPADAIPEFSEPPFLWGDPGVVRQRIGDGVSEIAFETETVASPALSPSHFWERTSTHSGVFVEILDDLDDAARRDLRGAMVETIEPYFDDRENAVELEYLRTTATVR